MVLNNSFSWSRYKILKKWNRQNANKIDSITGIEGYFHKNWNTLYSTIILLPTVVAQGHKLYNKLNITKE